jgi:uncharacterized membrane protein YjdF
MDLMPTTHKSSHIHSFVTYLELAGFANALGVHGVQDVDRYVGSRNWDHWDDNRRFRGDILGFITFICVHFMHQAGNTRVSAQVSSESRLQKARGTLT